jgi:hypothetical protein
MHAALVETLYERLRLAKQPFRPRALTASCRDRGAEDEAPDLDPFSTGEFACPLEERLRLVVTAQACQDQREAPRCVRRAEPVPDLVELGEASAQEALRRVEVAAHDLDVRKRDRIRRRRLRRPRSSRIA